MDETMSNKEAADILKAIVNNRTKNRSRANGKIMLDMKIDLAILKAIEALEQENVKQGEAK